MLEVDDEEPKTMLDDRSEIHNINISIYQYLVQQLPLMLEFQYYLSQPSELLY